MAAFSESSDNVRRTAGSTTTMALTFCLADRLPDTVESTGGTNAIGHGVPVATLAGELLTLGNLQNPASR